MSYLTLINSQRKVKISQGLETRAYDPGRVIKLQERLKKMKYIIYNTFFII
jgi:hypothetical protein